MTPDEKLAHYAKQHPYAPGRWYFTTPLAVHTPEQALAIIETCELLGTPVTDVVSAALLLTIADRLVHLDERVTRLERA